MIPGQYNLRPAYRGDTWSGVPSIKIRVRDTAAIASAANAGTDTLTAEAHGLSNGDLVTPATTAGGLTAGRGYYVIGKTDDTYQLSLTSGGDAVDLTAAVTHQMHTLAPPASNLASARMQFRLDSETGTVGMTLTTATDGGLEIESAADWELSIPARTPAEMPTRAGLYYYDLETTAADGEVATYLAGTFDLRQDVTRVT